MSENILPYSEHIYDQNRVDLARMILEKESRKLFLGLPDESWAAIDQSIKGWTENPVDYHLEDDSVRDFWDCFAAFMEGIKIKPNFTAWITAENVTWHRATVPVRKIQMTSPLAQLQKVDGLNLHTDLPFAELVDTLAEHPESIAEQKQMIDKHSTDPAQDAYPIILREADDGLLKVMDGNRRTLKAVVYGQEEMEAWVGAIDGRAPANFWVPLNDMFQLVKVYKEASEAADEQLQLAVVRVLKSRFEVSNVAEQAYRARIGNQTEIAKRLFDLTQRD